MRIKRSLFRLCRWMAGYHKYTFLLSNGKQLTCWTKTPEQAWQIAVDKEKKVRKERIMQLLDVGDDGTEQPLYQDIRPLIIERHNVTA